MIPRLNVNHSLSSQVKLTYEKKSSKCRVVAIINNPPLSILGNMYMYIVDKLGLRSAYEESGKY